MHPKDSELHPKGSRLFWTKRNVEVIIVDYTFQHAGKGFLNYLVKEVNGRRGTFAAYHDDLTALPSKGS